MTKVSIFFKKKNIDEHRSHFHKKAHPTLIICKIKKDIKIPSSASVINIFFNRSSKTLINHSLVNSNFRKLCNFKLPNREVWQKSKLEVALDKFLFYSSHLSNFLKVTTCHMYLESVFQTWKILKHETAQKFPKNTSFTITSSTFVFN